MREMFTRLHQKAVKDTGGSVECSKVLMGRGSAATTGVEGFYSVPDGVQIGHMFLLRPEGPGDVGDMFLHFKVSSENKPISVVGVNGIHQQSRKQKACGLCGT